jgi:hypothetical protein
MVIAFKRALGDLEFNESFARPNHIEYVRLQSISDVP